MSSFEKTLLALGLLGAITWIVTVVVLEVAGTRVRAAAAGEQTVAFAHRQARVAGWITFPAALLAIGMGTWIVRGSADYAISSHWWIGSLLGFWIVAMVGSLLLRAPRLRAVIASAEAHGVDEEDVRWRL